MKFSVAVLLAWLAAYVNAFALYGGYERMAFYYAYLLEKDLKGAAASKLANGCSKTDQPCSFKDFIKWINKNGDSIPKDVLDALPTDKTPDVDKTAQLLSDKNLCGEYVFDKVYKGSTSPANLFNSVALFVSGNKGSITDKNRALLTGVQTGYERVEFLRKVAASDKVIEALKAAGVKDIKTTPQAITPGGESKDVLNIRATQKANPDAKVADIWAKTVDDSHRANIEAAKAACGMVCDR